LYQKYFEYFDERGKNFLVPEAGSQMEVKNDASQRMGDNKKEYS
jgi:hypothetical protein